MAEDTNKKVNPLDDPTDTRAVAVDAFNKTIRKRVEGQANAALDQGMDPKELFSNLLQAYAPKTQPQKSGEDIISQVLNLSTSQVPTGEKKGLLRSFQETGSFKRIPDTEDLGISNAIQILKLQNTEGKEGREVKKQQLDSIEQILKIIPGLENLVKTQKGETLERDPQGNLTTEGIKQEVVAKKLAAAGVEKQQKFEDAAKAIDDYIFQFERAEQEILEHPLLGPNALEAGIGGATVRIGGKALRALDQLPINKAFQAQGRKIANQMARNVEGGRVTDQDREVYAQVLARALDGSSITNAELLAVQLIDIDNKIGEDRDISINPQIERFARSKSATLRRAAEIVQAVQKNRGDKGEVRFDPINKVWARVWEDGSIIELGAEKGRQAGFNLDRDPISELK